MPAGQRGPLSTRGTAARRWRDSPREVQLLVQPCRNRPAEFARCPRCPPGACQRRLLPLPVSVMLIFRCFLVQAVNFISYGVCKLVYSLPYEVYFLGQPCRNRPAEFARSSLSACGLPTPVVALACIGNVGIQVFSCAGGQLYLIRRLQVYLFIIFRVQTISQGVTLLFFFTEKKKRSKKRKEFAFHLYYKVKYHPKI